MGESKIGQNKRDRESEREKERERERELESISLQFGFMLKSDAFTCPLREQKIPVLYLSNDVWLSALS